MEELLNKLIEKGWKPFGYKGMKATVNIYGEIRFEREGHFFIETFRTLTSKESGLWQFVCKNGMVFVPKGEIPEIPYVERNYVFDYECYDVSEFQYWLMVGVLLKEDEIEQFLLDNIKIDG